MTDSSFGFSKHIADITYKNKKKIDEDTYFLKLCPKLNARLSSNYSKHVWLTEFVNIKEKM